MKLYEINAWKARCPETHLMERLITTHMKMVRCAKSNLTTFTHKHIKYLQSNSTTLSYFSMICNFVTVIINSHWVAENILMARTSASAHLTRQLRKPRAHSLDITWIALSLCQWATAATEEPKQQSLNYCTTVSDIPTACYVWSSKCRDPNADKKAKNKQKASFIWSKAVKKVNFKDYKMEKTKR